MEAVAAGADHHHLDAVLAQVGEGVPAQRGAQPAAAVARGDRHVADLAVATDRVHHPLGEAHHLAVDLGDDDEPAVVGGVQGRQVGPVVVGPAAVLVPEDGLADGGAEGLLVEGSERVEGEPDEPVEVVGAEGAQEHGRAIRR